MKRILDFKMNVFKKQFKNPKPVVVKPQVKRDVVHKRRKAYVNLIDISIENLRDAIDEEIDKIDADIRNQLKNSIDKNSFTSDRILDDDISGNINDTRSVDILLKKVNVAKRNDLLCLIKLESHFPSFLVHNFLVAFNASDYDDMFQFFIIYGESSDEIIDAISVMKRIIVGRKAKRRPSRAVVPKRPLEDIIKDIKVGIEQRVVSQIRYVEQLPNKMWVPVPDVNVMTNNYFTNSTIDQLIAKYKASPWLKAFTSSSVSGIVVKRDIYPQYVNPNSVIEGTDWYVVSSKWYTDSWLKTREFIPSAVGYLIIVSNKQKNIIVETFEMYKAAMAYNKPPSREITNYAALQLTARCKEVARILLNSNSFINIVSDKVPTFVDDIINNLNQSSIEQFAIHLSQVLVYLQKIINPPQIHLQRMSHSQYKAIDLVSLTEKQLLPEVFMNPQVKIEELVIIRYVIFNQQKAIQRVFYEMIEFSSDMQRIPTRPKLALPPARIDVNLPLECVENSENDVVYYPSNTENKLICYSREYVLTSRGIFPEEFIQEVQKILPRQEKEIRQSNEEIESEIIPEIELAPGLFSKLNDFLFSKKFNVKCEVCKTEAILGFRIPYKQQMLEFCSTKCSDEYPFDKDSLPEITPRTRIIERFKQCEGNQSVIKI
jgi:hypothetical protein